MAGCSGYVCHLLSGELQQSQWTPDSRQSLCGSLPLQYPAVSSGHTAHTHLEPGPGQCLREATQYIPQEWGIGSKYCGLESRTSIRYVIAIMEGIKFVLWDDMGCRSWGSCINDWWLFLVGWCKESHDTKVSVDLSIAIKFEAIDWYAYMYPSSLSWETKSCYRNHTQRDSFP